MKFNNQLAHKLLSCAHGAQGFPHVAVAREVRAQHLAPAPQEQLLYRRWDLLALAHLAAALLYFRRLHSGVGPESHLNFD